MNKLGFFFLFKRFLIGKKMLNQFLNQSKIYHKLCKQKNKLISIVSKNKKILIKQ